MKTSAVFILLSGAAQNAERFTRQQRVIQRLLETELLQRRERLH